METPHHDMNSRTGSIRQHCWYHRTRKWFALDDIRASLSIVLPSRAQEHVELTRELLPVS
eukprot:4653999-Amphidinium_carterae.1